MKYCCLNDQRTGDAYFEFQKGTGEEHWLNDSIYLDADVFDDLNLWQLFQTTLPHFNYYGLTPVTMDEWHRLREAAAKLSPEVKQAVEELDAWARTCFLTDPQFTICGV
jgi:hypothetical protein